MFGNLKELPEPIGKYVVGMQKMEFVDSDRTNVFSFADEKRVIPVIVYYPSLSDEKESPVTYSFKEPIHDLKNATLGLLSKKITDIKTKCYLDIPIATDLENYPVIVYNHGYFGYMMSNTVLCTDLASKGYIVVSVGHPHEGYVKYEDGSVISPSKLLRQQFNVNMNNRKSKKNFNTILKSTYSDEEIITVLREYFENYKSTAVWNDVQIWSQDTTFIADRLVDLNNGVINSIFKNKLNLDLGIGITGHSYGGCTATQVCLSDNRFTCGINMDAPIYGDYWDKNVNKPFMVIGSNIIENVARPTYLLNSADSYMVQISDTVHLDYTDLIYYGRQLKLFKIIGKRKMDLLRDSLSQFHLNFFDKYLRRESSGDIVNHSFEGISVKYKPEI